MNKKRMSRKLLLSTISAIMLAAVLLVVPVLAAATATRTLPTAAVVPGAEFDVGITVSGCGFAGVVKETLPVGFTYMSCPICEDPASNVGLEGVVDNVATFVIIGDVANFTYRVKAPAAEGTYTFAGTMEGADNIVSDVGGNAAVCVGEAVCEWSNLSVTPTSGSEPLPVTASADVTNTGACAGDCVAELKVDGAVVGTQTVTVAAGATETVIFPPYELAAGTYEVTIDALAAVTVTVTPPLEADYPSFTGWLTWWGVI